MFVGKLLKGKEKAVMNELLSNNSNGTIALYSGGLKGFAQELLAAIPLALASPILNYQRTKKQADLIAIAIEAKRRERTEILKTMQILARYGQLTPELSQQLMLAYNTQPY